MQLDIDQMREDGIKTDSFLPDEHQNTGALIIPNQILSTFNLTYTADKRLIHKDLGDITRYVVREGRITDSRIEKIINGLLNDLGDRTEADPMPKEMINDVVDNWRRIIYQNLNS